MEYITILGNTGFLACKLCKYSVLSKGLDYHFQKPPHKLPKEERSRILKELDNHSTLVQNREGVREVEIPSSFPYFFPDLALYSDGLGCQECSYYTRNIISIQSHFSDIHSWINPRKKGRTLKDSKLDLPWKSSIYLQQFFHIDPGRQYFRVDPNRPFLGLESHTRLERARSIQGQENQEEEENLEEENSLSIHSQGKYNTIYIYIYLLLIYYRYISIGCQLDLSRSELLEFPKSKNSKNPAKPVR